MRPAPTTYIESIKPVGDDGFYKAHISVDRHGEAITVRGGSLDECARRSVIVCDALIAARKEAEANG